MARTPDDLILENAIYSRVPARPEPVESSDERLAPLPPPEKSPQEELGEAALSPGRGGEASVDVVLKRLKRLVGLGGGTIFRSALDDADIHRLARVPEDVFSEIAASGVFDPEVIGDVEDFRPDAMRMGPPLAPIGGHLGLGPEDSLSNYDVLLGERENALRQHRQISERLDAMPENSEEYVALEKELEDVISQISNVASRIVVTEALFRKNPQIAMLNDQQRISALDMLSESLEG